MPPEPPEESGTLHRTWERNVSERLTFDSLPDLIKTEEELEELVSRPTQGLVDDFAELDGDIIVLGVAGKVGPSLARMAKRAAPGKTVIGVARFTEPGSREELERHGIETIKCDLLDRAAVAKLPTAANVVYMAGKKFGTNDDPSFAWAMNTTAPATVAEHYRESRIIAFSTLCVYPFGVVAHNGWDESVQPRPLGDYANSCVGRERAFEYGSRRYGTPGRLIRLNYAIDLRYGVLHDIASWVHRGEPIPIATGHASVIWQGDANAQILRALKHCTAPTSALNIGGPEQASVRAIAHAFGRILGKEPLFEGVEQPTAWVNSTFQSQRLFGYPNVPLARMIDWVADWVRNDGPVYDKPTRYEVRDGLF
ncbi:NAD(P)-dependent oxidoreductase [Azospirillum sp. RWY-5-1]|uniref:NAD(P)-dependent oxidoreductase n=1 Tax=Azospirillum oleiclasticum TaxID=2735135 RepID=A0ABX2TA07_9PROT|nr:NAD(P)-dependent oxidoreductase [Azospirillum oleiclasticum]NYZ21016.1 NAD(P)-dependent oxidoreductase [Azospirillum oleiclasticum]